MTVEQAVVEHLLADAAVAAIVGARGYQLRLPQSPTYPAFRVQMIGEPKIYQLRGGVNLWNSRIQTDAFADVTSGGDPYAAAADLADAIDDALAGRKFTDGGTPPDIQVDVSKRIDRRPLDEPGEIGVVRMLQDYSVWARAV